MQAERASNSSATSGSNKSNSGGTTTRIITTRTEPTELMPNGTGAKHEEWKTSKKIINHKTKQVETRVQRQIIMEDGKVIADSGPQITTKMTEDNHVEETENTEKKNLGDDEVDAGIVALRGAGKVVSEKTETTQTMKEIKEENMQLHDESIQEITGKELHQLALAKPGELTFFPMPDDSKPFRGKLTHYSAKSQKITDKEETKEVSRLNEDGEITTETTKTHHHEEAYDDEVPEDEVRGEPLPEASAETTRRIEFYRDGDDMDSLSDRMRKETETRMLRALSPERKDVITSKSLDFGEEEEIRNTETNRWLESHFGSDESDIVETTKTKAGGNVIKIEMSTSRRPSPRDSTLSRGTRTIEVKSPTEERDVSRSRQTTSTANSTSAYVLHSERGQQIKSDSKYYRSSDSNSISRRPASPSPIDVKKTTYGLFRRDASPVRSSSPYRREASPVRNGSPYRRDVSPSRHGNYIRIEGSPVRSSSPLFNKEPSHVRNGSPLRREGSPVRHGSPHRREASPVRHSSPFRREPSPVRRDSPFRRDPSPVRHGSPYRRDPSPARHSSPYRRDPSPARHGSPYRRDPSPASNSSPVHSTPTRTKRTYYMGQNDSFRSEHGRSSPSRPSNLLKRQAAHWKSSPTLMDNYYDPEPEERLKRYDSYQHHTKEHSSLHKANMQQKASYETSRPKSPERHYRAEESKISSKSSRNVDSHREKTHTSILKEPLKEPRTSSHSKDYYRNGTENSTVYATVKKSKHKEKKDCSVQVALSDEEEEAKLTYTKRIQSSPIRKVEDTEHQTIPRSSKKSSEREREEKGPASFTSTPNSSLNRPRKTFYFGDPSDTHYHSSRNSTMDRSKSESMDRSKKIISHTFDKERNPNVTYFPGGYYTIERDNRINKNSSSKYRSCDDLRNGHNGNSKERSRTDDSLVYSRGINKSMSSSLNNDRSYHDNGTTHRSFNTTVDSSVSNGRSYHDTRTDESYSRSYRSPKSEAQEDYGASSRSFREHNESSFSNGHSSTTKKDYSRHETSRRHQFMQDLLLPTDKDNGLWRSSSSSSLTKKKLPESRQRQFDYHSPSSSHKPITERSTSPSSPMPRLIRVNGNSGHGGYLRSSSPSPPDSPSPIPPPPPFQSNSYYSPNSSLTKSRPTSLNTRVDKSSVPSNPPNFTPLLSPTEIKNMANAFSSRKAMREEQTNNKYVRVKPERQDGAVVVEVREWDNR